MVLQTRNRDAPFLRKNSRGENRLTLISHAQVANPPPGAQHRTPLKTGRFVVTSLFFWLA